MTSLRRIIPKKTLLLFLGDVLLIVGAYLLAVPIKDFTTPYHPASSYHLAEILPLLTFLAVFYLADLYDGELKFASAGYVFRHSAGIAAGGFLLLLVFFLFPRTIVGRRLYFISIVLIGFGTLVWRFVLSSWYMRRTINRERIVIVGAGRSGRTLYKAIKDDPHYQVLGFMVEDDAGKGEGESVPIIAADTSQIQQIIKQHGLDTLVLAISSFKDPQLLKSVMDSKLEGIHVEDMPSFYERNTGKVPVEHISDFWLVVAPLLGVKRSVYNLRIKRVIDVVLSLLALVVTLPLSAVIAMAIKLTSPGPVLYRQRRVGLDGKVFTLVKFRSMIDGADADRRTAGEPNDPRITWIGKIIRPPRFDEIPQMWNVLKGDMSFIGPRALIESEVREFESKIPYFSLRHAVRPGITGWAQVNYRHGTLVEDGLEKLQYDLFYIKNLSPLLDFLILMQTVKVVMYGKGAR